MFFNVLYILFCNLLEECMWFMTRKCVFGWFRAFRNLDFLSPFVRCWPLNCKQMFRLSFSCRLIRKVFSSLEQVQFSFCSTQQKCIDGAQVPHFLSSAAERHQDPARNSWTFEEQSLHSKLQMQAFVRSKSCVKIVKLSGKCQDVTSSLQKAIPIPKWLEYIQAECQKKQGIMPFDNSQSNPSVVVEKMLFTFCTIPPSPMEFQGQIQTAFFP